ncbi:hypothetical protein [Shewanella goraebulensis]|uniref:hypothetical protein n=1 Tax=Shewanella goraebulensis TaxID=3050637 RepID=UPI00254AF2D3|nr:hypothetical protein [Shewanella goraebulensis]
MKNSMTGAAISLLVSFVLLSGCSQQSTPTTESSAHSSDGVNLVIDSADSESRCDEVFFNKVERLVMSGDGQGHGPDIGSAEWQSVIEFKLGVRGEAQVPPRDSIEWCDYIKQQVVTEIP